MLKLSRSIEAIFSRILFIRGHKVMIDVDLAALYGVETRVLVQAVNRNTERFPDDFMFQLTNQEVKNLRSQSVISSSGHGGRRTPPYAFTEQGVAMLSSVLNSPQAIAVNIEGFEQRAGGKTGRTRTQTANTRSSHRRYPECYR
jgi:hypothetical protein